MADTPKSRRTTPRPVRKPFARWSKDFLAELAATSNVSAAARRAGITTTVAYDQRRCDPEFNRAWQSALCEGYDHLEMELLRRLRDGEIKPAAGAKKGTRTFDNATALRLLAAHRESAARQRAIRSNEDSEAIIQSINAKLERIRQRRALAGDTTPSAPDDDVAA
ncbi:MAG: hypothetical protein ACLGHF_08245 [Alphaproteobacteria bacterium]